MPEWWTYGPRGLLMFSQQTYYRLFMRQANWLSQGMVAFVPLCCNSARIETCGR